MLNLLPKKLHEWISSHTIIVKLSPFTAPHYTGAVYKVLFNCEVSNWKYGSFCSSVTINVPDQRTSG